MYALNSRPSLEDHGFLLEQADWSWRKLADVLPALLATNGELQGTRRAFWISGLRRAWTTQGWAMAADSGLELLALARAWCDHPLALAVGAALEEKGGLDEDGALDLIACRHAMGDSMAARELAWRWQVLSPLDSRFDAAYRELTQWMAWREALPCLERDGLRLEPLGPQHLRDFAWQFHDPDIVRLCRLPEFGSDRHWSEWLSGLYRRGDELPLAVLHADLGFVGTVHLVRAGDLGFLYYWLGSDFRGQGLMTRAAQLLFSEAGHGLSACYAKVFEYNNASRQLLERLGFECLAVRAAPPDQDECFYRLGETASHGQVVEELHELMRRIGCETRVAAPLVYFNPAAFRGWSAT